MTRRKDPTHLQRRGRPARFQESEDLWIRIEFLRRNSRLSLPHIIRKIRQAALESSVVLYDQKVDDLQWEADRADALRRFRSAKARTVQLRDSPQLLLTERGMRERYDTVVKRRKQDSAYRVALDELMKWLGTQVPADAWKRLAFGNSPYLLRRERM